MKAHVNKDTCIGCGLCADVCAEVFEMDDTGALAVVKGESVPSPAEESCRNAADDCPVEAITLD